MHGEDSIIIIYAVNESAKNKKEEIPHISFRGVFVFCVLVVLYIYITIYTHLVYEVNEKTWASLCFQY